MTDERNPFQDEQNPMGRWELPYEELPDGVQWLTQFPGFVADSIVYKAGAVDTEAGRFPVVVFEFGSSLQRHTTDRTPRTISLVGDDLAMRASLRGLTQAFHGALHEAARRRR